MRGWITRHPPIFGIALIITCGWPLRHQLDIGGNLRDAVRRAKGR
jgi:hypothetical protein